MTSSTRSLWTEDVRSPVMRMGVALMLAPLVVSALLALGAFLIAGMTEASQENVMSTTIDSGITLTAVTFLFTLTFGLAGVCMLWALAQRHIIVWAATGAILGALAGTLVGFFMDGGPNRILLVAFAFFGWVLFLLIRRFARIQNPKRRREQSSLAD